MDRQHRTQAMSPAAAILSETRPPQTPSANRAWLRALEITGRIDRSPERLLSSVVEEIAWARPDAPALISDGETLSYGALAGRMRRYARWAMTEGLGKGDVVALMAPNRPDYMAAWLGLTSVGVVVALINTNLRGDALSHCVAVAEPVCLIASTEFAEVAEAAAARVAEPPPVWAEGRLDWAMARLSDEPLGADEAPAVTVRDPALLIYTSGTTGLPKAARVSHHRIMSWSGWFAGMMDAGPDDRLYDCLPMHHSVGGVVATGAMLVGGGAVVIAPKFSAGRFWDDIVRWDCTLFQYIGELCRYLVKAPPNPNERGHRLRMVCGNGLRPDVWTAFQARFEIPRILEFYAATEGNFSLYNVEGQPGAIGRVPAFMAHRFPAAIVAFDTATGLPARDADGRCVRCQPGEAGEAIGRIGGGDPAHRFEGYTSAADSEKKVLRDVFEPGDVWLRTGDLMRTDAKGFFYFVDRIGETFRWKGENVATGEVAEVIAACPGVASAAVYGVSVPGADGKAGMAAIVPGRDFDLAMLHRQLTEALPAYARPLFLRFTPIQTVTETFKQKKGDLAAEGFDPGGFNDPLFFDDAAKGAYVRLDAALFSKIDGGARLRRSPLRSAQRRSPELFAPIAASASPRRRGSRGAWRRNNGSSRHGGSGGQLTPGLGEARGIGFALVAEGVVLGGVDDRRRQVRKVFGAQGREAWIAQVMALRIVGEIGGDRVPGPRNSRRRTRGVRRFSTRRPGWDRSAFAGRPADDPRSGPPRPRGWRPRCRRRRRGGGRRSRASALAPAQRVAASASSSAAGKGCSGARR